MDEQAVLYVHYIKVWLDSIEEPAIFPVSKEEADRFQRCFDGRKDAFFVFNTHRGTHVALNLTHVQVANLLWDPLGRIQLDSGESSYWVCLHVRNRAPVLSSISEPVELADVLFRLDLAPVECNEVLSFMDEDGELIMFDPAALLYLEAPTPLVELGEEEMNRRDGVEANEPETEPQRQGPHRITE